MLLQDGAGTITTRSSVCHNSGYSVQYHSSANDKYSFITFKATLKQNVCYRLSCYVKTDSNANGVFSLCAYNDTGIEGYDINYYKDFHSADKVYDVTPRQNWTKWTSEYFILTNPDDYYIDEDGNAVISVAIRANLTSGNLWVDDFAVETIEAQGFINPIDRDGAPIVVTNKSGSVVYTRGVDWELDESYEPSVNELSLRFVDKYEPAIKILKGSRIQAGQSLRVSYYSAPVLSVDRPQIAVCLSQDRYYELFEESVKTIERILSPSTWFLGLDELRVAATCETCHETGLSAAQIVGKSVARQYDIIKAANPSADVAIWSDMLDPYQNAVNNYYLVDGDLTDTWKYVPKDLIVCCWNYYKDAEKEAVFDRELVEKSMKFFSSNGFRTIGVAYYDTRGKENHEGVANIDGWIRVCSQTNNCVGILYTTWERDYDYIEELAKAWKNAPAISLDSITLSSATVKQGRKITTTLSPSGAAASYQWYRYVKSAASGKYEWKEIAGAASSSYTPTSADANCILKVVAVGKAGNSGSVSAKTSAKLAKPNVAVNGSVLSWKAVPNAKEYQISYKEADGTATFTSWGKTDKTSVELTNLIPGKSYVVQVRALPASTTEYVKSDASSVNVVPSADVLQPPVNLSVSKNEPNSITLTWNEGKGAASYKIDVYDATRSAMIGSYTTTKTTYTISKLTVSTNYSIDVFSVSASQDRSDAVQISASTSDIKKLTKATGITFVEIGKHGFEVSWNAVPNAQGYKIYYKSSSDSAYKTYATVVGSSCAIYGLKANESYSIGIRALGDGVNYNDSDRALKSASTLKSGSVAAPANFACVKTTATKLEFAWDRQVNASNYKIELYTADGKTLIERQTPTSSTFVFSGLDPETSYTARLYACDGSNVSRSVSISASTVNAKKLTIPNVSYEVSGTSITLSWKTNSLADSYLVRYKLSSETTYTTLTTTENRVVLSGLKANSSYDFRVKAVSGDPDRANSDYSKFTSATTQGLKKLTKASGITAAGKHGFDVSWNVVPNAQGYMVYYKSSSDSTFKTYGEVVGASCSIYGLKANESYTIGIRALGDGVGYNDSDLATTSAKTLNSGSVVASTNFKRASVTATKLEFSWDRQLNASEYKIELYAADGKTLIERQTPTKSYCVFSDLTPETNYIARLYACDGTTVSRSVSISTATVSVKKLVIPAVSYEVSENSITIRWKANSYADSYWIQYKQSSDPSYTTLKTTENSATLNNLKTNTSYVFRVKSISGSSDYSNSDYSKLATASTKSLSAALLEDAFAELALEPF